MEGISETEEKSTEVSGWRKALATGLTSMFLATGVAQGAPPKPEMPDPEARERINAALVDAARRDISAVLARSETSYSRDLGVLQQQLTVYLQENPGSQYSRVIILDPHKVDVGRALNKSPLMTVPLILKEQHGFSAGLEDTNSMAQDMNAPHTSGSGIISRTTAPHAYGFAQTAGPDKACVIVPASDHAGETDVPGLSFRQRQAFVNIHEAWHCKDSRYRTDKVDMSKLGDLDPADYRGALSRPEVLEYLSLTYQQEAFADVAAVGDMVRAGAAPDVIEHVSRWRSGRYSDITHFSSPVLAGLQKTIDGMGLEKFRSLSDRQAQELYYAVTDHHGLSARRLQVALRYETGSPLQRLGYEINALAGTDVKKALDFHRSMKEAAAAAAIPAQARVQTAGQEPEAWDAQGALEQGALAAAGKITPASFIRAYETLYDELRLQAQADGGSRLYPERMMQLKATFTGALVTMDYVGANMRYGVRIDEGRETEAPRPPPSGPKI
jgi:hypothetical protein